MTDKVDAASFRDPSGFVYGRDGRILRQVNQSYKTHFDGLIESGLYDELVADGLLVSHEEMSLAYAHCGEVAYKVIAPKVVPLISYPYEWCFSAFCDAALCTLEIQRRAMDRGMCLKDASAYNIQFVDGEPVLIDTLSFELYEDGRPWTAYRQFCQHFLGPLSLMSRCDVRLGQLMRVYLDGVPLDLVSSLLPGRTRLNLGLGMHIHAHARAQRRYAGVAARSGERRVSKFGLAALVDSLTLAIRRLTWRPEGTEWGGYYKNTNYAAEDMACKRKLVGDFLSRIEAGTVWDVGANIGEFSRTAMGLGASVVSFDIDPAAVEKNYLAVRAAGERGILPLLIDLTNPSPAIGWANRERGTIAERGRPDAVMALALIHHLAISNNVPLAMTAEYFASLSDRLIIEWVPKTDSQVQRLLATREDIFGEYTQAGFEAAFGTHFETLTSERVGGSQRRLYLMRGVRKA